MTLKIFNDAITGCKWLQPRRVPAEAAGAGYWFARTWEGDKHGLNYGRFKQLDKELGVGVRLGFNNVAPYQFEFFRKGDIYGNGVPYHTPPFTQLSDYRYRDGLCPVLEDVMPRLATVNLIFLPIEEAKRQGELLRQAIERMDRG